MLFCKTCCILWGIAVHGNHNRRLSKSRSTNQPVRKYQERLDKTCFFSKPVDKYIGLQSAMELSSPMTTPKSNGLRQKPIVWQAKVRWLDCSIKSPIVWHDKVRWVFFHYSTNIVPFIVHDSGFIYDMKFFNFAVLHRKHLTNVLPFNYLFSLAKPDKKSTWVNRKHVFPHFVKNVDLLTACHFHLV